MARITLDGIDNRVTKPCFRIVHNKTSVLANDNLGEEAIPNMCTVHSTGTNRRADLALGPQPLPIEVLPGTLNLTYLPKWTSTPHKVTKPAQRSAKSSTSSREESSRKKAPQKPRPASKGGWHFDTNRDSWAAPRIPILFNHLLRTEKVQKLARLRTLPVIEWVAKVKVDGTLTESESESEPF
ncbi:hypothetical protein BDV06DRAFT_223029 [Aspergillus oleicola]